MGEGERERGCFTAMFQLDSVCEALMQDPAYLIRLYAKTADLLTTRGKDGSRVMASAFESVDRRYKSYGAPVDVHTLLSILRPVFPLPLMNDRELRVLLHMLPLTDDDDSGGRASSVEETGATPVRLLGALRRLLPLAAWQLCHIVSKVRAAALRSESVPGLELHLRDVLHGYPVERVTNSEVVEFLVGAGGGLSASEAEFVLDYCRPPPQAADERRDADGVDASLLHGLLFAERTPSAIEYPILAACFAEATTAGSPKTGCTATGSLALLEALRGVLSLPGSGKVRRMEEVAQEHDVDFPDSVMEARLTGRQFHDLCRRLGTHFAQAQSDRLYFYLTSERGALCGRNVVKMFRQYFPAVSSSHFQVVLGAVSRTIARGHDPLAFYALYVGLEEWGSGPIPIDAYVSAVRAAGVSQAAVPDLAVEWLRLKASTRVDLVLLLCMPVPPSREAVIRKLFERLDPQRRGYVEASEVLAQFQPERIEGDQVRRSAAKWKSALGRYIAEIDEQRMSYELFAFFWYVLSAGVDDDPTYTMVVWQGFCLAERRAGRQ